MVALTADFIFKMQDMGHSPCNIICSVSFLVRVRYIVKNAVCPLFYISCVNKLYYTEDEPNIIIIITIIIIIIMRFFHKNNQKRITIS